VVVDPPVFAGPNVVITWTQPGLLPNQYSISE